MCFFMQTDYHDKATGETEHYIAQRYVASEDITVYKVTELVLADGDKYYFSPFRRFPYTVGERCPHIILDILPMGTRDEPKVIQEGYHCFADLESARAFRETTFLRPLELMIICKYIIPKGSEYYMSDCPYLGLSNYREIISSEIIFTGEEVQ